MTGSKQTPKETAATEVSPIQALTGGECIVTGASGQAQSSWLPRSLSTF